MNALQLPSGDAPRPTLTPELLHELRTPLNQIIGYSELLAEQAAEDGQAGLVPDLRRIQEAGRQLLSLLNHGLPLAGGASPDGSLNTAAVPVLAPHDVPSVGLSLAGEAQPLLLVVDDNPANRDVLSRRLQRQGYAVAVAENGRAAMEAVRARAFDLVLLDVMMPEMDGYEVLQTIKADEALRHVPVIMISALEELDSVVRCIELGAEDYLPKPFEPTLLKARIGACLEKKRAHDRETSLFEQLQQNYKRLQELEKQRDDLTHMIVHDLRTPLTSLITGMHTLGAGGELDDFQREMVGISISGGETLLGMINDLLDVEKMESGAMALDYARLDAVRLVASAAGQVASLCEEANLSLVTQIPADLPLFHGDENKLRRVLVNLLGNAVKFTPMGGSVTLDVRPAESGSSLVFSVRDTGEGIPPEAFDRIFEKFGQVEDRKEGRKNSTGLGLTFCKLAVEAHGGEIGVASVPGEGSTFSFTIPIRVEEQTSRSGQAA